MSRWHHDHRSAPQEVPAAHTGPFTGVVVIAETSQVWSGYSRFIAVVRVTRSFAGSTKESWKEKTRDFHFWVDWTGTANGPIRRAFFVLSVTVWLKVLLHINVKIWVTEKEFKNVGK